MRAIDELELPANAIVIIGPVFHRELAVAPRKSILFVSRAAYAATVFVLMSTAWAVLTGAQVIASVGDTGRFGLMLFDVLAPLQLAFVSFYSAVSSASAVAQEKDRKTLLLVLLTRLSNSELVLGKLFASMLHVLVLIAAGLPIFMLVVLFGGVSFAQVVRVYAVTTLAAFACGCLGTTIAFWRDKTFQTLALVVLALFVWIGFWEVVHSGSLGQTWSGVSTGQIATAMDPLRAVRVASRPLADSSSVIVEIGEMSRLRGVLPNLVCGGILSVLLIAVGIARVRIWNPSRQARPTNAEGEPSVAIGSAASEEQAEEAREGHVDAKLRAGTRDSQSRTVWNNPILWREVCTWAYGRKVVIVRIVYLAIAMLVALGLHRAGAATQSVSDSATLVTTASLLLVPFFFVSLVILNAMAVTSITTERDGKSVDLLLATDLSPREFVLGKLVGVLSVAGPMVLAPMALCVNYWAHGGVSLENLAYTLVGLGVLNLFVATLGIHCGMRYANSRAAIGSSLGTLFFLFLGVVACLMMMVSFSGSFEVQLAPFLAFILGGGVGLFVVLGAGNPSNAITIASILVPFATFHSITSFLLQHNLTVFLVMVVAYGFLTTAMLVPSLHEFDFAAEDRLTTDE